MTAEHRDGACAARSRCASGDAAAGMNQHELLSGLDALISWRVQDGGEREND